jgi:hypothetical protein
MVWGRKPSPLQPGFKPGTVFEFWIGAIPHLVGSQANKEFHMLGIVNTHSPRRINLRRVFKTTSQNPNPPVLDLDTAPILSQDEAEELLGFSIDVYERD